MKKPGAGWPGFHLPDIDCDRIRDGLAPSTELALTIRATHSLEKDASFDSTWASGTLWFWSAFVSWRQAESVAQDDVSHRACSKKQRRIVKHERFAVVNFDRAK